MNYYKREIFITLIQIRKGIIKIPKCVPQKDRRIFNLFIKRVYALNRKFWGIDVPIIKIKLVYTREVFDKEWGSKTDRWLCAMANKNRIVMFAPSVFEQLTDYKLSYYVPTLSHEINHTFYETLVNACKPIWLMEGLAMLVAKENRHWHGKIDLSYLFYTYRNKDMSGETAKRFYRNSYLMTKKLTRTKGKKEIMKFLKKYKQHPNAHTYMQFKKQLPA